MPDKAGQTPGGPVIDMLLSVPADGSFRGIASELAAKVAEHLGTSPREAESLGAAVEQVASQLGHSRVPGGEDITFSFRQIDGELVIEARCNSQSSEVRHPLPA